MQKSGSTYVNKFLKECCTLKEIKHEKHAAVKYKYDPKNFYFITIRHPLALYSSLYRYGLDKRGGIYKRLKSLELTQYYKSFESFVLFMLDPNNANTFGVEYNSSIAEQIGFMTFRFMKLSLQFPLEKINNSLESGNNLIDLEQEFITNLEIKNEELTETLKLLATEYFPDYFDQTSVHTFIENTKKTNTSQTKYDSLKTLSNTTALKLLDRESLLLSRY